MDKITSNYLEESMKKYESISIIIPYHKNLEMLKLSLATLEKSLESLPEVIIVANNIDPSALNFSLDKKYKLIKVADNLFWPKAINLGVKHCSGNLIVFCDPDIFYFKNWLDMLLECYQSHKNVGAVGAKLINPQNNRIMDFGMFYNSINVIHSMKELPYEHPITMCDRSVKAACGAMLLTEKKLFEEVGGIDTDMPYIYCDNDYCLKLLEKNKEIWIAHKAKAYHIGATDSSNSKYTNFQYLREDSKAFFYAKNYLLRKNDFAEWLDVFWQWYKNNMKNLQNAYLLLDFCTLPDSEDYVSAFTEKLGLRILDRQKIILPQRNIPNIPLYKFVPMKLIPSNVAMIYFVDEFTSLIDNKIYFSLRDVENDIVIDKNCNIVSLRDIRDEIL